MNLYLLKARRELDPNDDPWNPRFDKAFGFVVRANNEEEARLVASDNAGDETRTHYESWTNPRYSTCVELTSAGKPGFILCDFHAA